MPLIKLNNRSIKDVTSLPFGVGNLIHIQSQTASNSASISFTTGINSTYKEYQFYFINIHPATDGAEFEFNMSTDGGANYNVTKATTYFLAYHDEADTGTILTYSASRDLAQSTGFQRLSSNTGNDNDQCAVGSLSIFNPSSTTYVKHYISTSAQYSDDNYINNGFSAGYGNTTSAVNAIQFKMSSGNIDDGTIALFGVL
jgi:hypothetical protein